MRNPFVILVFALAVFTFLLPFFRRSMLVKTAVKMWAIVLLIYIFGIVVYSRMYGFHKAASQFGLRWPVRVVLGLAGLVVAVAVFVSLGWLWGRFRRRFLRDKN